MLRRLLKCKRAAALVEYSLLVAGVALIGAAAVSVFGHKTSDMIAAVAAVLPGAHTGDNGPIVSGHIIETVEATGPATPISLDIPTILANSGTERLSQNVMGDNTLGTLVLEP